MVANAGAGPAPIPYKQLTVENLAEAIRFCLSPEASTAAAGLAKRMDSENGIEVAAESFLRNLPLERMRCDVCPDLPAVWSFKKDKKKIRLSKFAAETVLSRKLIDRKNLEMYVPAVALEPPLDYLGDG